MLDEPNQIRNFPGERVTKEVLTEEAPPSAAPLYIRTMSVQPEEIELVWQAPACLQTNGEITEYEYEARLASLVVSLNKSYESLYLARIY